MEFTIEEQIRWHADTASENGVYLKETKYLVALKSNDPAVALFPVHFRTLRAVR